MIEAIINPAGNLRKNGKKIRKKGPITMDISVQMILGLIPQN